MRSASDDTLRVIVMRFAILTGPLGCLLFLVSHPAMMSIGEPTFVGWDVVEPV